MAFVKKVWAPGEDITAAEMQNIEDGLDDIYNQIHTFSGKKTFQDNVYIARADAAGKELIIEDTGTPALEGYMYSGAGIAIGIAQKGSFPTRFETSGSLAEIVAGMINSMYVENHAARHNGPALAIGADPVLQAATIIVDQNGKGDYTDFRDAVTHAGSTDYIYVREGEYYGSDIVLVDSKLTIIGAGPGTIIHNNMTVYGDYFYMSNLKMDASLTMIASNAWLDMIKVEGTLSLNGSNNCFYKGNVVGSILIPTGCDRNIIIGNELQNTSIMEVESNRNVFAGNTFLYSDTSLGDVLDLKGDNNIVIDNSSTYGNFLIKGDNNAVVGNTMVYCVVSDTGAGNTVNNIEF